MKVTTYSYVCIRNNCRQMFRQREQVAKFFPSQNFLTGERAYMWECGISVCWALPNDKWSCPWAHNLCTFPDCLMWKSNKVSYNMTQIARVLAIATIFICSWIYSQRRNTRQKCLLKLKVQGGGAYAGEGGYYSIICAIKSLGVYKPLI